MYVALDNLNTTIHFDGTDELYPVLQTILHGWALSTVSQVDTPLIVLDKVDGNYRRRSPWLSGPPPMFPDPVDAVCDALLDLQRVFMATQTPPLLALHAAAVQFNSTLVAFPSTHATGKSTFVVHLAAHGHHIFADDVLPIRPATDTLTTAIACGMSPRLRLPLPEQTEEPTRLFINAHRGPHSSKFQYVALPAALLAQRGAEAALGGIVLLERQPGVEATLTPAREEDVMKQALLQSFGGTYSSLDILDYLHAMISTCTCFHLQFDQPRDTFKLLEDAFA